MLQFFPKCSLPTAVLLLGLMLMSPAALSADDAAIAIHADPQEIELGDQSTIVLDLGAEATKVVPPDVDEAELHYAGKGSSTSISIINGKASQKTSVLYNFLFVPKRKGNFTIPSFEVVVNGKSYKTDPFQIRVTAQGAHPQQSNDPFAEFDELFNRTRPRIPEVYLRLTPTKNYVRQNEQLVLTMEEMTTDPSALQWQLAEASPAFFDKMVTMDAGQTLRGENVRREGDWYVRPVKRVAIFPVDAGDLAIRAPVLVALSPYGQLRLTSHDIAIRVVQPNQTGGIPYIGKLQIKAVLSTNSVPVGSSVDLTYEMTGDGNMKLFADPLRGVNIPGAFLSAPISQNEITGWNGREAAFRQRVTYSVLAQKEGTVRIPPLSLSVIDSAGGIQKSDAPELVLKVLPAAPIIGKSYAAFRNVEHPADRRFLLENPLCWILLVLSVMALTAGIFYGRYQMRLESDPAFARNMRSGKRLSGQLAAAEAELDAGRTKEFHRELQKGLFYYFADKYNLPAGITFQEMAERLRVLKLPRGAVEEFEAIWKECSAAAYGGPASGEARKLLERASVLIDSLRKR
jgi:hypothetical protein